METRQIHKIDMPFLKAMVPNLKHFIQHLQKLVDRLETEIPSGVVHEESAKECGEIMWLYKHGPIHQYLLNVYCRF